MKKSPYAKKFEKKGINSIHDLEGFVDQDVVKKLVGKNYDIYRDVWLTHYRKGVMGEDLPNPKGKYTWLVLLTPIPWLAYRKAYGAALYIFIAILIVIISGKHYGFEYNELAFIGGFAMFGFYAKVTYFEVIYQRVEKYKKLPNNQRKARFLKRYGGTSTIWAILSLPMSIITLVACLVLYSAITGEPFNE